jgi:hypothetical protein
MRAGREGLLARFPRAFWWSARLLSTAEALRRRRNNGTAGRQSMNGMLGVGAASAAQR